MKMTISVPKDKVNVENLRKLLSSKGNLIKKSLGTDSLEFETTGKEVKFPWFDDGASAEEVTAYIQLIEGLCKMTVNQKRIQAKEREVQSEKYTFRCFLLRLGFVGDEYKTSRKILLKNLAGDSAFKDDRRKEAR